MIKKVLVTAALGATVFGVSAASASSLDVFGPGAWGHGVAQQSNPISATCNTGKVEMALQVADAKYGSEVTGVNLAQQSISAACNGTQLQAALTLADGSTAYSDTARVPNDNQLDILLPLPAGVKAQDVTNTVLTFADSIHGPKNTIVK